MPEELSESRNRGEGADLIRIRSKHRRRLLGRLTEGGATVSELANDVGLRVPHASAELKRLRNDGLVSSDQSEGSRGASMHLTQFGWEAIRSDELSRAREANPLPSNSEMCCLLSRDGPNLLIGVLQPIQSPIIPIPTRPPEEPGAHSSSTGREGVPWTWAVFGERDPRWFDLSTMEPAINIPGPNNPENIDTYSSQPNILGLIRARLLDYERPIAIAPGQWFAEPSFLPPPPLPERNYHRGEWALGVCHPKSPEVRPRMPIAAVLSERLPRTMILRTARLNSLVIADLGGLDIVGEEFPLGVLSHWIERAHPRLEESERQRRLLSLQKRVSKGRGRTDDSTWRRFRADWGNAKFVEETDSLRQLDIRGLGTAASQALIKWALTDYNALPLTLEIDSQSPEDLVSEIAVHPNLRLVLLDSDWPVFSNFDRLENDPIRPLPWLKLTTESESTLSIRLLDPIQSQSTTTSDDLQSRALDSLGVTAELLVYSEDDESVIMSAISQHPGGNEEWANQMEARYPLAAWIASPPRTRWPRWQRLRGRLDSDWLVLLNLDDIPLERLSEIAEEAPDSVLEDFSNKLEHILRSSPEKALRMRPASDPKNASRGDSWVAAQLLSSAPWLSDNLHSDLISWALDAWLCQPPIQSMKALEGVDWLFSSEKRQVEFRPIIEGIQSVGSQCSEGHDLKIWASLAKGLNDNSKLSNSELKDVLKLPPGWWGPISSAVLSTMLEDEESRSWILSNQIPWCAAILRPVGESCDAPGLNDYQHPGCNPELLSKLSRRLRGRSQNDDLTESADSIIDLLDALEAAAHGTPPRPGRTHSYSGWLAQPIEEWPIIDAKDALMGDPHISERIILRKSGYRTEFGSLGTISG
ncbi:MAG: ArsR family transcriptional regulator [Candidatus Thermoplasmatota archaeon]|jgi:DNA-binding transcriptional ArsR family regulator|nr:ArsR family transcriptional regulator [Candidatus Thermoplasmatota archaeon]|tara:strand:- start:4711 stop:7320 length:2610 start_codon:yes stop_codon:yes gene_type:complete